MRAAAVLVALLALSGCATTSSVPPAATATDVEAFVQRQIDAQWRQLGLPDDLRPEVRRERFVSTQVWGSVVAACMKAAAPAGPALTLGQLTDATTAKSDAAALAWYTCQAQYPIDPDEYVVLSGAQIDYLYDYYERWALPCIRSHGYPVGGVPSRAQFLLFNGLWDPVYHAGAGIDLSSDEYERLTKECGLDVVSRFPLR